MNVPDGFSITAEYYKGRTAYADQLFEKLARELNINKTSTVLDLACGRGEISFGLSPYAGQVVGVDKSDAMLENTSVPTVSNVAFYQQDLNRSLVKIETKVDFVTIGRAIQHLNLSILKETLSSSLKHGGLVIVCGAGFGPETSWLSSYQEIRKTVRQNKPHPDFHGLRAMKMIGFSYLGTIGHTLMARYSLDDIINHALSYSSQTKTILENIESFTSNMERALTPFKEKDGKFSGSEYSWGNVFRSMGNKPGK